MSLAAVSARLHGQQADQLRTIVNTEFSGRYNSTFNEGFGLVDRHAYISMYVGSYMAHANLTSITFRIQARKPRHAGPANPIAQIYFSAVGHEQHMASLSSIT